MLPISRKPEILRLHQLQQTQRTRYINQFSNVGQQWLPTNLYPILPMIADIYYTYTTICKCRRRLGEEYTYVAMYNPKHYEEEGVLVNSNTRTLMFVLQITQRHLIKYLLTKLWARLQQKVELGGKWKIAREIMSLGVEGILKQGKLLMLMLFLLGWNKYFNLVDTILKNQYAYTYFNKNQTTVDYRVQGYMLLAVLIVKLLRFIANSYKIMNQKQKVKHEIQESQVINEEQKYEDQETDLCRICYDPIKDKSVTCCGHVFCWECILKYLATRPQCPVCRSECQPKQVIQLQNY